MPAAIAHRTVLLGASALSFAFVTIAYVLFETPGLGIGHFFYLSIALAALSGNSLVGGGSGLVATALFGVGVALAPGLQTHEFVTLSTVIRGITFVSGGMLIGYFASHNRRLVEQLRELAGRDHLTGLRNVRSFDEELGRRCAGRDRFAVLIGDLDGLKETNDREGHAEGNRLLRRAAGALTRALTPGTLVARIGGDEYGVIVGVADENDAAALAGDLERDLKRRRVDVSFGWALYPDEGLTPTELFRRADDRLYGSKSERKSGATVVALRAGGSGAGG